MLHVMPVLWADMRMITNPQTFRFCCSLLAYFAVWWGLYITTELHVEALLLWIKHNSYFSILMPHAFAKWTASVSSDPRRRSASIQGGPPVWASIVTCRMLFILLQHGSVGPRLPGRNESAQYIEFFCYFDSQYGIGTFTTTPIILSRDGLI